MSIVRSLYRALRSRWLAVWLIVGVIAWSVGVTFAPRTLSFTNPLFLAAVGLLAVATATCAWERTAAAIREWRDASVEPEAFEVAVLEVPTFEVPIGSDELSGDALARAQIALGRLRMRVRAQGAAIAATSNHVGLLGSPLFHWALVALIALAALGQLTRAEGTIFVPIGGNAVDEAKAYQPGLRKGPLFGDRFTGAEIVVESIDLEHVAEGVARGPAARVALVRDGERATKWVYPNSTLSSGSLTLHIAGTGPALLGKVATGEDVEFAPVRWFFENSEEATYGIAPKRFALSGFGGSMWSVIEVAPSKGRRVIVRTIRTDSRFEDASRGEISAPVFVYLGESAELPGGFTLSVDRLTGYAKLHAVNDWTLPWIYAAFALGLAGMALTVLMPPRSVWIVAEPQGDMLAVRVRRRRSDPAFGLRVLAMVQPPVIAEDPGDETKESS